LEGLPIFSRPFRVVVGGCLSVFFHYSNFLVCFQTAEEFFFFLISVFRKSFFFFFKSSNFQKKIGKLEEHAQATLRPGVSVSQKLEDSSNFAVLRHQKLEGLEIYFSIRLFLTFYLS
jgi:hypothetical protein